MIENSQNALLEGVPVQANFQPDVVVDPIVQTVPTNEQIVSVETTTPIVEPIQPQEPDFVQLYNTKFGTQYKSVDEYQAERDSYRSEAETFKKVKDSVPLDYTEDDIKLVNAFKKNGWTGLKEIVELNTRDFDSASPKDLIREQWERENDGYYKGENRAFKERAFRDYFKQFEHEVDENLDEEENGYVKFQKSLLATQKAEQIKTDYKSKKDSFLSEKVEGVRTVRQQNDEDKIALDEYLNRVNETVQTSTPKGIPIDLGDKVLTFNASSESVPEIKKFMYNPGEYIVMKCADEKGNFDINKLYEIAAYITNKEDITKTLVSQGQEAAIVEELNGNMRPSFTHTQPSVTENSQNSSLAQLFQGIPQKR